MKLTVLLFFCITSLFAQNNYSLRLAHGQASRSDLGKIISGDFTSNYPAGLYVTALDAGYMLNNSVLGLPLDFYIKNGFSVFDDRNANDAMIYESTLYFKIYLNMDFLSNRLRLGFGEGASYTSNILYVEKTDAEINHDNNSKILNYLDISLDFDFGRLIRYKPLYGTHLGWALKHRSGIFGLINSVRHGGSNYNTLYIEKNF